MDHNATTPLNHEIFKAMQPYFEEKFGNASSIHAFGREAKEAMEKAREQVAKLLGADPSEIVFTSGGTESNNFALKGLSWANEDWGKRIITSQIEHHAVLNPCEFLEKQGFEVVRLKVDKEGRVDLDQLQEAINEETLLISIMHANNEVGTIQDIKTIGKIAKEKDVYFHTDAVQTVGKIPIDVKQCHIDLLSLSAHKIYGPKGVGALYIRKGTKMWPLQHGGHHERNRRAGTENVPGIVGLGKACEISLHTMKGEADYLQDLRDRLQHGIEELIDDVYLNGHATFRLPGTLSMCFQYVEGESIVLNLDLNGVAASSGSACTSGSLEPSHVLMAMGVPPDLAQGSVRFSLGRDNTKEDVERVLEVLPEIIQRLRKMSPFA